MIEYDGGVIFISRMFCRYFFTQRIRTLPAMQKRNLSSMEIYKKQNSYQDISVQSDFCNHQILYFALTFYFVQAKIKISIRQNNPFSRVDHRGQRQKFITISGRRIVMTTFVQPFVHDSRLTTLNNEDTFLQDFLKL